MVSAQEYNHHLRKIIVLRKIRILIELKNLVIFNIFCGAKFMSIKFIFKKKKKKFVKNVVNSVQINFSSLIFANFYKSEFEKL